MEVAKGMLWIFYSIFYVEFCNGYANNWYKVNVTSTAIFIRSQNLETRHKYSNHSITSSSEKWTIAISDDDGDNHQSFTVVHPECRKSRDGLNYQGTIQHDRHGHICKQWSETEFNESSMFKDSSVLEAKNYCRNPDNFSGGPWCFSTDYYGETSDWCAVPMCSASAKDNSILGQTELSHHYLTSYITEEVKSYRSKANETILIGYPIFIIVGTICNTLSIIVFFQPSLRHLTVSLLLIFLAVADSLILYIGALDEWIKTFMGWYMSASTSLTCKIYRYTYSVISSMSSWIMVLLAIERVISLSLPFRAKIIFTKKTVCLILVSILLILCILNIPGFTGEVADYEIYFNSDETFFTIQARCINMIDTANWIGIASQMLVPFILLLVLDIVTIKLLIIIKRNHHNLSANKNKDGVSTQTIMISTLFLVTTFSFLVLSLPYAFYIAWGYFGIHLFNRDGIEEKHVDRLFFVCAMLSMYMNHSINFIFYCIGMKRFRVIFIAIISNCICGCIRCNEESVI